MFKPILFPCASKSLFGIDCPICGFQRSFWLFCDGHFIESFKMYPPLIPSIIVIIAFTIHIFNRKVIPLHWLKKIAVFDFVIVMTSYFIKLWKL